MYQEFQFKWGEFVIWIQKVSNDISFSVFIAKSLFCNKSLSSSTLSYEIFWDEVLTRKSHLHNFSCEEPSHLKMYFDSSMTKCVKRT
jgi:hypothetical protein